MRRLKTKCLKLPTMCHKWKNLIKKPWTDITQFKITQINLKLIPNSKSSEEDIKQLQSEEDINQLQSKTIELQDVSTVLNKEVERLVRMETVSVPYSEKKKTTT